MLTCRVWYG